MWNMSQESMDQSQPVELRVMIDPDKKLPTVYSKVGKKTLFICKMHSLICEYEDVMVIKYYILPYIGYIAEPN